MDHYLIEMLECPVCHEALEWKVDLQIGEHIETGSASCLGCGATYPVRDGIGIFLTPDLPRDDLWEQVDSNLTQTLSANPVLMRQLVESPLKSLSPTDQQLRAIFLEDLGKFDEARIADLEAKNNLYTPEYLACWDSQTEYMLNTLTQVNGPIIDLASGRGYLVERIVSRHQRPVVATDFSLQVLRRNRKYFQHIDLYDAISFLAFDARRTPFKNRSVKIMTANLGLPNIHKANTLPRELKRISDGVLLAISLFFQPDDEDNGVLIKSAGLDAMLYRENALRLFEASGWSVRLENPCISWALPTPDSTIFKGARADGLPVTPTSLEWGVLHAKHQTNLI